MIPFPIFSLYVIKHPGIGWRRLTKHEKIDHFSVGSMSSDFMQVIETKE